MNKLNLIIICTLIYSSAYCQYLAEAQFKDSTVLIPITMKAGMLLVSDTLNITNQYKKSWLLGTSSEIFAILDDTSLSNYYLKKTIGELGLMSPDSICTCIRDLDELPSTQYETSGDHAAWKISEALNNIAFNNLPLCKEIRKDDALIYFLLNDAAYYWKYDITKAFSYFEKLKQVTMVMLLRDILSPGKEDQRDVKDPLRRYIRYMCNLYFSNNPYTKAFAQNNNCLEKAWEATQLIKSREFKSLLIEKSVLQLRGSDSMIVISDINFIDSLYGSNDYFDGFIDSTFLNNTEEVKLDSIFKAISKVIPDFNSVLLDNISLTQMATTLNDNEVYVSFLYMDNNRSTYAWELSKGAYPKIIRMKDSSLELFIRTEYFRNEVINRASSVLVNIGTRIISEDLSEYARIIEGIDLDPVSNAKYLSDRLLGPLNIKAGKHIILEIDQNLGAFPFGLLKNPNTNGLLMHEDILTFTPSASIFYYLRNLNDRQVYDFDYAGFSYNYDPTSFVDRDISYSSENFTRSSLLFQCTKKQIFADSSLGNTTYLHFACHSRSLGNDLYLVLRGNEEGDSLLGEREIIKFVSNHAMLTALTSCSIAPYIDDYSFIDGTLVGDTIKAATARCVCSIGKTFSNVTGAFFAAGTHEMLVSQWNVPDSRMSALFIAYFFKLLSEGYNPSIALRDSQIEFSTRCEPKYWAGFIIVGS